VSFFAYGIAAAVLAGAAAGFACFARRRALNAAAGRQRLARRAPAHRAAAAQARHTTVDNPLKGARGRRGLAVV
jgi:hypothetical protein